MIKLFVTKTVVQLEREGRLELYERGLVSLFLRTVVWCCFPIKIDRICIILFGSGV